MSLRAQLSLLFEDKDLYNQFIVPCKQAKSLNGIIIRCLSAYYYNEEVRNMIEGSPIHFEDDASSNTSTQEICQNIRNTLMMQSIIAGELEATINNGTQSVEDILSRTNKMATESGLAKEQQTGSGGSILQIEQQNADVLGTIQSHPEKVSVPASDATFTLLITAIRKLAETSGNQEVIAMLHGEEDSQSQPVKEIESSVPVAEVISVPEQVVQEPVVEVPKEEPKPTEDLSFDVEDDFAPDEVKVDATQSMLGLIESLGF